LTWKAPVSDVAVKIYRIYRDSITALISEVPATQLIFEDHNRKKNTTHAYYIMSQGIDGSISLSVKVTIHS